MALSRNARRMKAKARLEAKSERIAKASMAATLDHNRKIVSDNMSKPKGERNVTYTSLGKEKVMYRDCYPESNWGNFAGESHRAYVSRASGSMSKRSTQQVMAKVANKNNVDTYARPAKGVDKSAWPVTNKKDD